MGFASMATRVMCLGKYKEFGATNANKRRIIGYFYGYFYGAFVTLASRFASRFSTRPKNSVLMG